VCHQARSWWKGWWQIAFNIKQMKGCWIFLQDCCHIF
jgi:hypothetical protein